VKAYEEIVDFIASGPDSAQVAGFQISDDVRTRVGELIQREKLDALSPEEKGELEHYMEIEHLIRLAKARAREKIVKYLGDASAEPDV
jgi:hypothetical protein